MQHWVLWDGKCAMCARAAAWIRRNDVHAVLWVIPYQEAPTPPMTWELAEACAKSIHVVTDYGTTLKAGRACLFVLGALGWRWTARVLWLPPFVWLVELGYQLVARHRTFFSRFLFRERGSPD